MEKTEIRQFNLEECRFDKSKDGETIVRGYAAVFGQLSEDLGGFKEQIDSRAFDNVLEDDVVAVFNHDMNIIFGRTSSGTLKLSVDERGLVSEITMPNTQAAKDTIELMRRGDINKMSFGFIVDVDKWKESERGYVRTVKEVKRLIDVSLVTKPAYPQTTAAVRSLDNYKKQTPKASNISKNKVRLLKLKK